MIYTYSPNWYRSQCLHFRQDSIFYSSNYTLYELALSDRVVHRELCLRQVALQAALNHHDIKINGIASTSSKLLIALNQPFLAVVDADSLQIDRLLAVDFEIDFLYPYKYQQSEHVLICSKEGHIQKFCLDDQVMTSQRIDGKHKLGTIKAIYQIEGKHMVVFSRGSIAIYADDFGRLVKSVEVGETIFSVDHLRQEDKSFLCFLVRGKQGLAILSFQYYLHSVFPLEAKRRPEQIGVNIKRHQIDIQYPRKMVQKLKQHSKASLSIKFLSSESLILTGKLGQIFTIHQNRIKSEKLCIRPYSCEQQLQEYEVWTDGKHYRQIYSIYEHQGRIYLISTDHNLSVWLPTPQTVKFLFTIKFLTAPVAAFFHSEHDPRMLYALLKDSAIRSFSPLEEGSHQLSEYWKFSRKYSIKKAITHPNQQGILALVTACHRVQIYDAQEDRLMKLIEIGEEILNLSFELPTISSAIQTLFGIKLQDHKPSCISHFQRDIQEDNVLLIQTKSQILIISGTFDKQITCLKGAREKRLERIHGNKFYDGELLLASQTRSGQLEISINLMGKILNTSVQPKIPQGRVLFKSPPHSRDISIVHFKGNRFSLQRLLVKEQNIEMGTVTEVSLPQPIDYLLLNYMDDRAAVYCQRDDALIILYLNKLIDEKIDISKNGEDAQLYSINTKIDTLCFYLDEHIVLATKDQAIKVLPIKELPPLRKFYKRKPQNILRVRVGDSLKELKPEVQSQIKQQTLDRGSKMLQIILNPQRLSPKKRDPPTLNNDIHFNLPPNASDFLHNIQPRLLKFVEAQLRVYTYQPLIQLMN